MTLTTRLLWFFLSTLALVLIGFSTALFYAADKYLYRQADERLDTIVNSISDIIETDDGGLEWDPDHRKLNLKFSVLGDQVVWIVADEHASEISRSPGESWVGFLADAKPDFRATPSKPGLVKWRSAHWIAGQRWIRAEENPRQPAENDRPDADDHGLFSALSVTAGVSLAPVEATLKTLVTFLIALSVGIWSIALVAGRAVCHRALRPVRQMALAAREIDATDIADQRLPVLAIRDELGEMNGAFNNLLDRLQEAFERQRRFTADASHQFRTPLTAILGQTEVALRRERTVEEYRQSLATVHQKAVHLSQVVDSLLFLARTDGESRQPDLQLIELTTWLPEHLKHWSDHPRAPDLVLENSCPASCLIAAQPALLGELLNILLDNACKYSPPSTPIEVRLSSSGSATIEVADRGWGIEPEELSELLLPFTRGAKAREGGIEGVGLGLSIANRLSKVFHGTLTIASRPGSGSCFTVMFPLKTNPPAVS